MGDDTGPAEPRRTDHAPDAPDSLPDQSTLVDRTVNRLERAGVTEFRPTPAFYDDLQSAFRWACLEDDSATVPADLAAALDDARVFTREDFADRPDADLRGDVVRTYCQYATGFYDAYR